MTLRRLNPVAVPTNTGWAHGHVMDFVGGGRVVVKCDDGRRIEVDEDRVVLEPLVTVGPCNCQVPRGYRCGHGNGDGVVVPLPTPEIDDDELVAGGHA